MVQDRIADGTQQCSVTKHPERQTIADQARVRADQVVFKAMGNKKYRDRLRADPEAVLCAAGLPVGPIEDIRRELVIDGASLAISCSFTCWWTCLITSIERPIDRAALAT